MKKKDLPKGYIPSVKDAEWLINNWREEGKYSAPVNAISKICQAYPNNNNLEEVLIKCAVIDNFSSTNVFDLYSMAEHIIDKHIDEKLKKVDYSVVIDIAEINIGGKKRNFYSFASKYCHYHNPEGFAIYDSYVAKILCSFPNDFRKVKENNLREDYKTFIDVLNDFNEHYRLNLSFFNLDKYLWRLGRWYLNPYEPTPKYYHREDENPFSENDVRNMFWYGEMMFVTTHQKVGEWKEKGKEFQKKASEKIRVLASKLTPEQFGVVTYISALFGKWCPYDNQTWLIDY
ncbi:MAG: hypothetical protein IKQ03_14145 [Prevotella sp.]|nr:hypothetical protein [Prevotella sp.]